MLKEVIYKWKVRMILREAYNRKIPDRGDPKQLPSVIKSVEDSPFNFHTAEKIK